MTLGQPAEFVSLFPFGDGAGRVLRLMAPVTGLSLVLLSAAVLCLPCRPLGAADIRLNRPDRRGAAAVGSGIRGMSAFGAACAALRNSAERGGAGGPACRPAAAAACGLQPAADFSVFLCFVGNMKALPTVSEALSGLVAGRE